MPLSKPSMLLNQWVVDVVSDLNASLALYRFAVSHTAQGKGAIVLDFKRDRSFQMRYLTVGEIEVSGLDDRYKASLRNTLAMHNPTVAAVMCAIIPTGDEADDLFEVVVMLTPFPKAAFSPLN